MTDYGFIIPKIYPGKPFILRGDDYEGLEWIDESPKPTQEELDAAYIEYCNLNNYKTDRAKEYPTIAELTVALIEKEEGRPEALNDLMLKRLQIKNKYPKPVV